ncbi:hypothetical protein F5B22DRAFT_584949 [Xylaria bambusicola]|uniref:uncharacterized protein n=1 Tax=Xylaria bambusicola TaxID=326684 RepID=UPI0020086EF4|nr:uncharacterized protein F5B22DRAFT_584949 [Xylaria bambusicola]KAI0526241.1 hypothetical protein F5B22DRAFT_584949 [Xylaria bambusicola]
MPSRLVPDGGSPHLLNQKYAEDYSFPQFALLPWELRNQVWRFALQKRRLLHVNLSDTMRVDGLSEHESRSVKYGQCFLIADGFQAISKLLRVSSEARSAALEFYRVRLPCVLNGRVGKLPFNPEYDILWFQEKFERINHLTDFISAVIEHDNRRVGLCNLAVSITNGAFQLAEVEAPHDYMCPAFEQAVSNICEFYLVSETNSYHLASMKEGYNLGVPSNEAHMTQSLSPLMSDIPSFDLQHRDPRPVENDIACVFLGFESLMSETQGWNQMLVAWGVDQSQLNSRVLFVYRDSNPCLPAEEPSRLGPAQQRSHILNTDRPLYESTSASAPSIQLTVEKQPSEAGDSPAIGFWLFPFEAFVQKNMRQTNQHCWNLSNYWPELGLFHLPTGPHPL